MSLSPRHEHASRPIPPHPYRDSALLYAGLAVIVPVLAALTGGDVERAAVAGVAFFVLATAWAWVRMRQRIRAAGRDPKA